MSKASKSLDDQMTDFQFKAILAMVLEMLNKFNTMEDVEETKKAIAKLSGGLLSGNKDEND